MPKCRQVGACAPACFASAALGHCITRLAGGKPHTLCDRKCRRPVRQKKRLHACLVLHGQEKEERGHAASPGSLIAVCQCSRGAPRRRRSRRRSTRPGRPRRQMRRARSGAARRVTPGPRGGAPMTSDRRPVLPEADASRQQPGEAQQHGVGEAASAVCARAGRASSPSGVRPARQKALWPTGSGRRAGRVGADVCCCQVMQRRLLAWRRMETNHSHR